MNADEPPPRIPSAAANARPSTPTERQSMLAVVDRMDAAKRDIAVDAVLATFHPAATCELKPAGLRITARETIAELFRRSLPALVASFSARRKLREWSNQSGLVREWSYPLRLSSGEEVPTTQLEIIEFSADLARIRSYRLRMNSLFSTRLVQALGEDFGSLPGIERIAS